MITYNEAANFFFLFLCLYFMLRYRDGAGNTVEENSSIISLIWMR